jgi:hypothetical protein
LLGKLLQRAEGTEGLERRFPACRSRCRFSWKNSIQIAWDYLERSGDLGDPDIASEVLLSSVESMVRLGERRRLMLSNKAINDYK